MCYQDITDNLQSSNTSVYITIISSYFSDHFIKFFSTESFNVIKHLMSGYKEDHVTWVKVI